MKTLFCWISVLSLVFTQAQAKAESLLDLDDAKPTSSTSEYVYRSTTKGNLIPVQIMGSVGKPGLYFVPPNTNLIKVLTLAGGPQASANSERIVVKKADKSWDELRSGGVSRDGASYRVDIEDLLRRPEHSSLSMSANDVVFVPNKEPFISSDAMRVVTVVSLVMTTVLTAVLIHNDTKK